MDKVSVRGIIRDFDQDELDRRSEAVRFFGKAVERKYPGGRVDVEVKKQYSNMYVHIEKKPEVMEILEKALLKAGVEPKREIIRGNRRFQAQ